MSKEEINLDEIVLEIKNNPNENNEDNYKKIFNKLEDLIWQTYHKKCKHKVVEIETNDVFQEAYIAIIQSLEKFDPNRNVKFITYVYRQINWRISDLLKNNGCFSNFKKVYNIEEIENSNLNPEINENIIFYKCKLFDKLKKNMFTKKQKQIIYNFINYDGNRKLISEKLNIPTYTIDYELNKIKTILNNEDCNDNKKKE